MLRIWSFSQRVTMYYKKYVSECNLWNEREKSSKFYCLLDIENSTVQTFTRKR